ncbi:hypothetical protein [Anaerotalea alkaliphila]|uniref:Uncharacterized protein n=1 Tax=Anaerotalea alkaliphila TaxID=2662126 RepID=A0A7X5KPF3_9FIRM|nr:hypothetical protein [Anaerotalea alkaliphila]NDL68012.1 hypothetical protein [Anaerotalea alkaliphila]
MIIGTVRCKCGQLFGFETTLETVACPKCQAEYVAVEHEDVAEEPVVAEEEENE